MEQIHEKNLGQNISQLSLYWGRLWHQIVSGQELALLRDRPLMVLTSADKFSFFLKLIL